MIRLDVVQGTPAWRQARIGLPTASGFDNLLTPALKPSSKAHGYLCRLVAERILGRPLEDGDNAWMERGREMEEEGRRWYEVIADVAAEPGGLCLTDDRRIGCSPDALIGEDGGLEVKVPAAHTHVGYVLDPDSLVATYRAQVQGCLLVTGRKWWDLISYNPEIPAVRVRVEPDKAYLEVLEAHLRMLLSALDKAMEMAGAQR